MKKMPRQRESEVYGEYDARSYAHLVPGSNSTQNQQFTRKAEKKKKSKHKTHKRSKDKEHGEGRSRGSSSVELVGRRTSIVAYEDVSSDSGSLSDVSGSQTVSSRVESRSKKDQSPASAMRTYLSERSHSNSPVIRDTSPIRSEKSAKKSKKRHRSPELVVKNSEAKHKMYAEAPKAYVEPPKAYAEMSSSSKSAYRSTSPSSMKKRYRSRSPTSPYRKRSRSRYGVS